MSFGLTDAAIQPRCRTPKNQRRGQRTGVTLPAGHPDRT